MAQRKVKYNLYYINDDNQEEHLISETNTRSLIDVMINWVNNDIEDDFHRLELIANPYSGKYLVIDIMYKTTKVIAEWSPRDNILEELIDIMFKGYGLNFKLEEVKEYQHEKDANRTI